MYIFERVFSIDVVKLLSVQKALLNYEIQFAATEWLGFRRDKRHAHTHKYIFMILMRYSTYAVAVFNHIMSHFMLKADVHFSFPIGFICFK